MFLSEMRQSVWLADMEDDAMTLVDVQDITSSAPTQTIESTIPKARTRDRSSLVLMRLVLADLLHTGKESMLGFLPFTDATFVRLVQQADSHANGKLISLDLSHLDLHFIPGHWIIVVAGRLQRYYH